jgi:hypothetical protein
MRALNLCTGAIALKADFGGFVSGLSAVSTHETD